MFWSNVYVTCSEYARVVEVILIRGRGHNAATKSSNQSKSDCVGARLEQIWIDSFASVELRNVSSAAFQLNNSGFIYVFPELKGRLYKISLVGPM